MAKRSKAQARKRSAVKDLAPRNTKAVTGGRAGGDRGKYMEIKMTEILVSSAQPSGSGG